MVSVITPAYNQAGWLPDCLKSVASQTYKPVEHIVVDDGSTDHTSLILRGAPASVRSFRQENAGQSAALNRALREAKGEIIGWLNSDDAFFDVRAVESAVAIFERHPDVDIVYGHAALVNSEGLILQLIWMPPFSSKLLRFANFIAQPATFVRREALADSIVDEAYRYAMDRDLWLRLLPAHRFKRLNAIVGIDRHHSARKGIARPDLVANDIIRLLGDHHVNAEFRYKQLHRLFNIARRLIGVSLIPRADHTQLAFTGVRDGDARLLLRQVAVPRRAMPEGSPRQDLDSATRGDGKP